MKIAIFILGVLGAVITFFLGATWVSDWYDNQALIESMGKMGDQLGSSEMADKVAQLETIRNAGFLLIGGAVLGLVGALVSFKKTKLAGILLLVGALVPGVLAPKALAMTSVQIVAGVLAMIKSRKEG